MPKRGAAARERAPGTVPFYLAFDDPNLFGPHFSGPSWNGWRAVLKAAHGVALNEEELEFFRKVADRDPPKRKVRELWVIAGRRSGKDSVASAMATHAALTPYGGLRPGEAPTIMCLACDKEQARIVTRYSRGYFDEVPLLKGLIDEDTQDGFTLTNGAEFAVLANNFRSVRGRTVAFAVLDECAFYRSSESVSPDYETYNAIVPGMATIDESMLVAISSPHRRAGLLYQKWRESYGKNDDDVLVIRAPSQVLNPTLPDRVVNGAMAQDPALAKAEYMAEWRDDLATWLDRELIERSVDFGVAVRPPIPGVEYRAFADPSSGIGDSYTAAIAHLETNGVAVLDCLVSIDPPFNPIAATEEIAATLKQYGVPTVTGDRYAQGFVTNTFAACGITYVHSQRDRSDIYNEALPLYLSGKVRLLDNKKLVTQLASLERRTMPGGKDKIDHPERGGHDDSANSVCGVFIGLSLDGRPALARQAQMEAPAHLEPYRPPLMAKYVIGVVVLGEGGMAATIYLAEDQSDPNDLYVCDFDYGLMSGDTFGATAARLHALGAECRTGAKSIWCEESFLPFARATDVDGHPFPEGFDAETRLLSVAAAAASGKVKIAELVTQKSRTSPLSGAFDLRVGDVIAGNPLKQALVTAVSLCRDIPVSSGPAKWGLNEPAFAGGAARS
jgi:hypothetical protein